MARKNINWLLVPVAVLLALLLISLCLLCAELTRPEPKKSMKFAAAPLRTASVRVRGEYELL